MLVYVYGRVWERVDGACVKIRGQLVEWVLLPPYLGSQDQTQVVKLVQRVPLHIKPSW